MYFILFPMFFLILFYYHHVWLFYHLEYFFPKLLNGNIFWINSHLEISYKSSHDFINRSRKSLHDFLFFIYVTSMRTKKLYLVLDLSRAVSFSPFGFHPPRVSGFAVSFFSPMNLVYIPYGLLFLSFFINLFVVFCLGWVVVNLADICFNHSVFPCMPTFFA